MGATIKYGSARNVTTKIFGLVDGYELLDGNIVIANRNTHGNQDDPYQINPTVG